MWSFKPLLLHREARTEIVQAGAVSSSLKVDYGAPERTCLPSLSLRCFRRQAYVLGGTTPTALAAAEEHVR